MGLRAVVVALVGFLIALWDPFGISHHSDEASTAVFLRMVAPWYTTHKDDRIAVVLITKRALVRISHRTGKTWTWPLSFEQHQRVLETVSEAQPRTIFYDIAFYQERERDIQTGLAGFEAAIRDATGAKAARSNCGNSARAAQQPAIPIYLAAVGKAPLLPGLCSAGAEGVWVDWPDEANLYPMAQQSDAGHGLRYFTPARRMYDEACGRDPALHCQPIDEANSPKLSVVWPVGLHPQQPVFGRTTDCGPPEADGWFGKFLASLKSLLLDGVRQSQGLMRPCLSPLVIPVDQLLFPNSSEALYGALQGKYVMIGGDVPALNDEVLSPVNGKVPGVFVHAAALDNLLRWHRSYSYSIDERPFELTLLRGGSFIIIAVFVFLTLRAIDLYREHPPSLDQLAWTKGGPSKEFIVGAIGDLAQFAALASGLAALLLAIAAVVFAFGWAPINWLGATALIITLTSDKIIEPAEGTIAVLAMSFAPARWVAQFFLKKPSTEGKPCNDPD